MPGDIIGVLVAELFPRSDWCIVHCIMAYISPLCMHICIKGFFPLCTPKDDAAFDA